MFSHKTVSELTAAARQLDIEPAALLAVAAVESGGVAFAIVDKRQEPLIRFEGHYFYRRLPVHKRASAQAAKLASPYAGRVPNPRTQTSRWRLLENAMKIERQAALESTSWGIGQVMGAHWAWLGYADVEALVAEARSGVSGQARLMLRFIEQSGLTAAFRDHRWAEFARGYNGPAFRRLGYDEKLAIAYRRFAAAGRLPME